MDTTRIIPGASDAEIADWLHRTLGAALKAAPGRIAITIPGGSTPFPILAELAALGLDWSRISVWPGDDRIVAEDHPASNVGRIRRTLEPLGATVVALEEGLEPPRFGLAWLGMGTDGHIASLFPNTDPQPDTAERLIRLVPDPLPPEAPFARLSLTIPALLNSDQLVFVIRGDEKQALFEAALAGAHDLPVARLLAAAHQPVTCFT
ncbi:MULTISPECIES: 6-phosphogluconolactonase [unclassified Novosphingobium]|uniref:6-phosphogluconolactonase n=1 Tax=unclassified Novosphingobium TaxID=2644732 RepID=UPI000EE85F55|nr:MULTISPECIES: 6-phosphogluconolactonase [unclassified Novosphingobium]HCF25013.1 6-phosphogluconolactonase [Novosphingobium sp.]HQV01922.1 6-phosphogluconolactonase [Novosphingobium sp.]